MIVKIGGKQVTEVKHEVEQTDPVHDQQTSRIDLKKTGVSLAASLASAASTAQAAAPGAVVEASHPVYMHLQDFAIISFPFAAMGLLVIYVTKKKWLKPGLIIGCCFYAICFAGHGLGLLLGVAGTYFNDYLVTALQTARGGM